MRQSRFHIKSPTNGQKKVIARNIAEIEIWSQIHELIRL